MKNMLDSIFFARLFVSERKQIAFTAEEKSPSRISLRLFATSRSEMGISLMMDYVNAFWVGGLICALVQLLMEKTKMMPGRIMVLLVVTGTVISILGWYEPFQEFAGAGASVPLLGFGNVLMKGVKEAVDEQGFLGLFAGGFKAGAVGTSAALIFGYLASLVFKPHTKG